MFKATCIDAANKPNDIPTSQWLIKDKEYTVIAVCNLRIQPGVLGFKLAEVNLDGCFPYLFYASTRFGIAKAELDRMVKEGIVQIIEEEQPQQKEKVQEDELVHA